MSYLKSRIKQNLPLLLLDVYRRVRDIKRIVFRHVRDKRARKIYLGNIFSRFPELSEGAQVGHILDLGANLGDFSAACLSLGFEVTAVEPHPDACKYLERRFLGNSNLRIVKKAISPFGQTIQLQFHPDHKNDPITTSLSASIIEEKFKEPHEGVEVESASLADFFSNGESYDILKIDIEGAEVFILSELILFAPRIRRLLLETHLRFMKNSEYHKEYEEKLEELERYIVNNNLEKAWFTNWV